MGSADTPLVTTLDGFETIFKENYTPLFRYVKTIVRDEDVAKDVLSDLFLHLWQHKDNLQIDNIKSYLFRSARNGALKAISPQAVYTDLSETVFEIPSDTYTPFERFVNKQSIKIVEELINKLPPLRREMIELRLLGLKNHEIARALDLNDKKVEYNMREAIEQLSRYINNSNLDKATIAGGLMLIHIILSVNI
jgi:RNA polymerase sigma-70 factor (ECF subfamily)